MITYYLDAYPEELLASHLARYAKATLTKFYTDLSFELFNVRNAKLTLDLPTHLDVLHQNYFHQIEESALSVILKYTLYTYYEAFIDDVKKNDITNGMLYGPGSKVHSSLGISAGGFSRPKFPRYCQECLLEGKEKFGEYYLMRVHQIPDLHACPHHNLNILEYFPTSVDSVHNPIINLSGIKIKSDKSFKNSNSTLYRLSQICFDILTQTGNFQINTGTYRDRIKSSKYYRGKTVDVTRLTNDFTYFFGEKTIDFLFSKNSNISIWLPHIINRPTNYFHPLRHILINEFLQNIENNGQLFTDYFNPAPWSCLNLACSNYQQKSIHDLSIQYNPRYKTRVATAKCTCGMTYSLRFVIENGKRKERLKIQDYGDLWVTTVKSLISQGHSINSIAQRLKTSPSVVNRHVKPSKIDLRRHNQDFPNIRDQFRKDWIALLTSVETNRITFAKQENYKLYKWLSNNDKIWLQTTNTLYKNTNKGSSKVKLDWNKVDDETVSAIVNFIEKLKGNSFSGRISKNLISKVSVRIKYLSDKNSSKLPKSFALMKGLVEDMESFQIRKIKDAISQAKLSSSHLSKRSISKSIKVSRPTTPKVQDEFNRLLQTLN